jgi:hypothetical protein
MSVKEVTRLKAKVHREKKILHYGQPLFNIFAAVANSAETTAEHGY